MAHPSPAITFRVTLKTPRNLSNLTAMQYQSDPVKGRADDATQAKFRSAFFPPHEFHKDGETFTLYGEAAAKLAIDVNKGFYDFLVVESVLNETTS